MSNDTLRDKRKRGFFIIDNELVDEYGPLIGAYGIAVYNVIARHANGEGSNSFPSYQTIADKLKMSRGKVITTIKALVKAGLVTKAARQNDLGGTSSNEYALVSINGGSYSASPSVYDVPPSTPHAPPSTCSEPPPVHVVNPPSSPHALDQYTIKKTPIDQEIPASQARLLPTDIPLEAEAVPTAKTGKGERKGKRTPASVAAIPIPEVPASVTPDQAMFAALCGAIGWDYKTMTSEQRQQVAQAKRIMLEAGYTAADVEAFRSLWAKDWRGRNESWPTLSQIRAEIGKVKAAPVAAQAAAAASPRTRMKVFN